MESSLKPQHWVGLLGGGAVQVSASFAESARLTMLVVGTVERICCSLFSLRANC